VITFPTAALAASRVVPPLYAPYELRRPAMFDAAALHARFPALGRFHAGLGKTELIEVPSLPGGARIVAKCEWQNPAGSIKDRVAYALLAAALQRHGDRPLAELKILEYSGGNLAAALSKLGHALGLQTRFVLSSFAPPSLLDLLAERGARVELVDKSLGFYAVIEHALKLAAAEPDWTLLYQHRNAVNVQFHHDTTGAEILRQLNGRQPDAWVASIGTGGTLIGVSRALRAANPRLRTIGATPAELPYASLQPSNGLPKYAGSGGMGCGIRQPFVRADDEFVEHRSLSFDDAMRGMAEFRALTGLKIGSSASANWQIARHVARELSPQQTVVTVFPDAGTPEEWKRALS
jgi:cysteine synthase